MAYLIIDEQHRIYKATFLSGYVRSQAKQGNLSVVNLMDTTGMNIDGSWSDIQEWDPSFKVDEASCLRIGGEYGLVEN